MTVVALATMYINGIVVVSLMVNSRKSDFLLFFHPSSVFSPLFFGSAAKEGTSTRLSQKDISFPRRNSSIQIRFLRFETNPNSKKNYTLHF